MKKFNMVTSLLLSLTLILTCIHFSPVREVSASTKYTVHLEIPVYNNANDAMNKRNVSGKYPAGTYFVYKSYNGMINISRKSGVAGAWINPSESINNSSSDIKIKGWLSDVLISPGPYIKGNSISFTAYPTGEASRVNEYALYRNGKVIVGWTKNPVFKVTLESLGSNTYMLASRNSLKKGNPEDSRSFVINVQEKQYPKAWLSDVTVSPDIAYVTGRTITFKATPYQNAASVNEYALMIDGKLVTEYSPSPVIKYTPKHTGKHSFMLVSRNRITKSKIEDSRTFVLEIKTPQEGVYPKAWLSDVKISDRHIYEGEPIVLEAIPMDYAKAICEYAIFVNGKQHTEYSTKPVSVIKLNEGTYSVMLVSRNQITHGKIEDSRTFKVKVRKDRKAIRNSFSHEDAEELMELINEYRAQNGLYPLKGTDKDQEKADIVLKKIVDHFKRTGKFEHIGYFYNANAGYGYPKPRDILEGWKKSPPHNANLLSNRMNPEHTACSMYTDENGMVYWSFGEGQLKR